jgi:hypothetical protein
VGVPVHGAAVMVCELAAAIGSVPDRFAPQMLKPENGVLAIFIVLPPVATPAISPVINMCPVVAAGIVCDTKAGKTLLPAAPGVVKVESNVAVPASKVEDVEYQHFKLIKSDVV